MLMKNFQDKLCDGLTLAGLAGVIGYGLFLLAFSPDPEPRTADALYRDTDTVQTAKLPAPDTLENIRPVQEEPQAAPIPHEDEPLPAEDTVQTGVRPSVHPEDTMKQTASPATLPSEPQSAAASAPLPQDSVPS